MFLDCDGLMFFSWLEQVGTGVGLLWKSWHLVYGEKSKTWAFL